MAFYWYSYGYRLPNNASRFVLFVERRNWNDQEEREWIPSLQPRVCGLAASAVTGAVRARGGSRRSAASLHDGGDDGEATAGYPDDDARAADSSNHDNDDYEDTDVGQRHREDRGEPVGLQKTSGMAFSLSCVSSKRLSQLLTFSTGLPYMMSALEGQRGATKSR